MVLSVVQGKSIHFRPIAKIGGKLIASLSENMDSCLRIKAFWPLNTESDLDAKLRKCIDEYKELVNGQGIHTDGIRSIDSTLSLRFAREDAKEFIDKIRELTSLINQADGESKLTLWMVPEDFLIVGSEKPFDYVNITVSEAGRMKIRACSL